MPELLPKTRTVRRNSWIATESRIITYNLDKGMTLTDHPLSQQPRFQKCFSPQGFQTIVKQTFTKQAKNREKNITFTFDSKEQLEIKIIRWPRELNALQIKKKTPAN